MGIWSYQWLDETLKQKVLTTLLTKSIIFHNLF